jgi:hypothetical protein
MCKLAIEMAKAAHQDKARNGKAGAPPRIKRGGGSRTLRRNKIGRQLPISPWLPLENPGTASYFTTPTPPEIGGEPAIQ